MNNIGGMVLSASKVDLILVIITLMLVYVFGLSIQSLIETHRAEAKTPASQEELLRMSSMVGTIQNRISVSHQKLDTLRNRSPYELSSVGTYADTDDFRERLSVTNK